MADTHGATRRQTRTVMSLRFSASCAAIASRASNLTTCALANENAMVDRSRALNSGP